MLYDTEYVGFYYDEPGEDIPYTYSLFVLKSEDGQIVMVDSGRPSSKEIIERGYPYSPLKDDPDILEAVSAAGVNAQELFPGIRVVTTPGHTPGSQSVLVDTAEGQYLLCGDWAYFPRNWEEPKLIGFITSAHDWFRSYEKVMDLHAVILPSHAPFVLERKAWG